MSPFDVSKRGLNSDRDFQATVYALSFVDCGDLGQCFKLCARNMPALLVFFTDYYFYRTSKPESAKEVNPAACEKEMLCTSKTSNKAEHRHNASAHMCVQGSSYSLCADPLSDLFFTGSL